MWKLFNEITGNSYSVYPRPLLTDLINAPLRLLSVCSLLGSLRVGESGIFECSTENSSHASYLQWILNDDTVLLNGNQSADGRFANENGILTMSNLTVQHSGEYQCFDPETNSNVTSHLKSIFLLACVVTITSRRSYSYIT
uniref:Ig-like domain-containing protein n=1 Tax=Trichobilharzia regenti TaxID=157069 RepID=A0AA85K686_TRIRE|nr:unnamed protein product [Trichobilharzia regenti]